MRPVPPVNVVVAATAPDIQAEGIAGAIAEREDMTLVSGRVLAVRETDALLESHVLTGPCGIVLVGPDADTEEPAERYLAESVEYVVMRVTAPIGDIVRVATHRAGLQELLIALRSLVDQAGATPHTRVAHFRPTTARSPGPLLNASIRWLHETFRNAVDGLSRGSGDLPGLTVTASTLVEMLDGKRKEEGSDAQPSLIEANAALVRALATEGVSEPLARISCVLALSGVEFRLMLLALAPELDPRYQRCVGVLLDDLGRRVGTLGLYSALLGEPVDVRLALGASANLARLRVFETLTAGLPAADEPLRMDSALAAWILGERDALARDPRVRRVTRSSAWPGAALVDLESERLRADTLVDLLQGNGDGQRLLFAGADPAGWRALLELGAQIRQSALIRVEATRIATLDVPEIEECGVRLGRAACLTDAPLIVDMAGAPATPEVDQPLRALAVAIASTRCRVGVICTEPARVAKLLGEGPCLLMEGPPLSTATRARAFARAARNAGTSLTLDQAQSFISRHPLQIDGFEQVMSMARSAQTDDSTSELSFDRFMAACKEVSAEGLSQLAQRIEPIFTLDDVVLPNDRKQQLKEIVDNVLLAGRVLDDWKFGEQLPYGRGVTALLHGPSGTGKTMAALAIANRLGVQILRIDLSRVVSKYIGDTEKNIDRVFDDARHSGAALLIDEADALLGKRSEVKDAHDRYANIEVAYLLQRMEAYEGLAIMTTNLRQNLDAAFLRRIRFMIDFPRPNVEAREEIWQRCLPDRSHVLQPVDFRQLARKIDLTGGHIRQITLRAAFVAAAANKSIDLAHVAYATNAELAKLGRPPVALELPNSQKVAA
jgi:AAA+ superfamily predicted ATPase